MEPRNFRQLRIYEHELWAYVVQVNRHSPPDEVAHDCRGIGCLSWQRRSGQPTGKVAGSLRTRPHNELTRVTRANCGYFSHDCGVLDRLEVRGMKWIAAGLAFAAVAAAGTLIALQSASGAPADTTGSTATTAAMTVTTDGSTVSASSSASSSCVVSSSVVNGVATTETSGCDASAQACSVVVSATNDVTTTTQTGTCGAAVSIHVDLRELRRLVSSWIWFLFSVR